MKFGGFAAAQSNSDRALAQYFKGVRIAISATVQKLRGEIKAIHAKGNFPPDYSLGFANGLIFAEHKVCGYTGNPSFYNRTTSVGKLPKPIALDPADFELMIKKKDETEAKYLQLLEKVFAEAETLIGGAPYQPTTLRDAISDVKDFCAQFTETGEVEELPKQVKEEQPNV